MGNWSKETEKSIKETLEMGERLKLNLPIVTQRSELLSFIKEVSEWDKEYSSTRLKLIAKELVKLNCG